MRVRHATRRVAPSVLAPGFTRVYISPMTTNRTDCAHLTSATVDGNRRCAECGCDWYSEAAADKRDRANAKAAAKVATPAKIKDMTAGSFEAREYDRERRRNRYTRTGR